MQRIAEGEIPAGHLVPGCLDQRLPVRQLLELFELDVRFRRAQRFSLQRKGSLQYFGKPTFVRGDELEDFGIKRVPHLVLLFQPEDLPVFFRFLPEDAHVNLVRINRVFEVPHRHAILQGIGELLSVIVLDERGMDEVLVPLVDVFGATTGAGVDRVDDDVQNQLADESCPMALGHEHCQIEKCPEIEDSELWNFGYVNETCFVNIRAANRQLYVFQAFASQNLIPVPFEFRSTFLQIIVHRARRDLEKSGHLLLEHDGPAFKLDSLDARGFLDLGERIRVVQDVLPINL